MPASPSRAPRTCGGKPWDDWSCLTALVLPAPAGVSPDIKPTSEGPLPCAPRTCGGKPKRDRPEGSPAQDCAPRTCGGKPSAFLR